MDTAKECYKAEILRLFEQEKTLDYHDIILRLDIPLELAVQICEELEVEGRIEAVDDA